MESKPAGPSAADQSGTLPQTPPPAPPVDAARTGPFLAAEAGGSGPATQAAGQEVLEAGRSRSNAPAAPAVQVPGYEVLGVLGRGGMGVVYKARQLKLNRLVALKMILSAGHAGPEALARFRSEAEALARLQHPHIVQIFEVGESDGLPYFALEYLDGGSLASRLDGAPRPPREAAALVETLARAVHAAHLQKVVHRDLKPANVLLTADGQPKVTDFGLAKKLDADDQLSRTGQAMGTPSYMPPEQAAGRTHEIGPASDVYALGAILYELLTGRPPFRGPTVVDTMQQVLTDEPVPPRRLQPRTPADLETVCLKCLEKDPRRRYAAALELAEELRRFQAGEPVRARAVGAVERGWKWARRRPAVAGLLTAFVAALLLGTALSTYFALDARRREAETGKALEKVTEREKQLGEANTQLTEKDYWLEETLARSLLRPLGQTEFVVADPEIEALWELAGSTERVRLLFVEQPLRELVTARQLRRRADLAVHTAVGLDPSRRRRVEDLLLARLRDAESDSGARTECVVIGLALGDTSPEFAGAAARQVLEAIARPNDPEDLRALSMAIAGLAPRLGPDAAAPVARQALEAMTRTKDAYSRGVLSRVVADLAPRLGPDETAAAARQVLQAIAETKDADALSVLLETVKDLAPRLGPDDTAAAARQILEALTRTNAPGPQSDLSRAFGALAQRLAAGDAAMVARQALEALTSTSDPKALYALSMPVASLAPHLGPDDAATAARQVLKAMAKTRDFWTVYGLSRALGALAPRLGPDDASAVSRPALEALIESKDANALLVPSATMGALAPRLDPEEVDKAARLIAQALGKTNDPTTLQTLSRALAALGPRLGADGAAAAARQALEAMAKANDPYTLRDLAGALAALGPRLGPNDAAAAARQIVQAFARMNAEGLSEALGALGPRLGADGAAATARQALEALAKTDSPFFVHDVAGAVAPLAPWLGPDDAAAAAVPVVQSMAKTNKPDALRDLSRALSALAPRLAPGAAAVAAGQAREAMARTIDREALNCLAGALAALESRLGPDAATEQAAAARIALDAMAGTKDLATQANLAGALATLAPRLGPDEAAAAARHVLEAMGRTTDPETLRGLSAVLSTLIAPLDPEESAPRTCAVAAAVGNASTPPATFAWLAPLTAASWPPPGRFTGQQLVDLLKTPTCGRLARQGIVEQLSRQYGRPFADVWEFVDWAGEHCPNLDLTSPPVRPEKPVEKGTKHEG